MKFPTQSQLLNSNFPYLIAEIGINHNGNLEIAKQLISHAKATGFNAVKFQKRTIEIVYSQSELDTPRESVFGSTNRDLKVGLEFDFNDYVEIDKFCRELEITWFASPWDLESVSFLEQFEVPAYKIASASLTDSNLLSKIKNTGKPVLLSTGMSTMNQVQSALTFLDLNETSLLHCVSTYPAVNSHLNLQVIETLRDLFQLPVGYSGHEKGILPSVIAASKFRACIIERHVTIDRSMWGSDQSASLEPAGMSKLVQYLKESIECCGDGVKKVLDSEISLAKKLRRVQDF